MFSLKHTLFACCLLLLGPLLACGLIPEQPGLLEQYFADPTPTPIPSPTPLGNYLIFTTQTHEVLLNPGQFASGSNMRFVNLTTNGYEVVIDGRMAYRQPGDSLSWSGVVAPGVLGSYNLRLVDESLAQLRAYGPVQLTVLDPFPIEAEMGNPAGYSLAFSDLTVNYAVPVGHNLPGSSLIYVGPTAQGAELSGTRLYPYVQEDNSLTWSGQLRNNVFLRYQLRVLEYTAEHLIVTGTAELLIK